MKRSPSEVLEVACAVYDAAMEVSCWYELTVPIARRIGAKFSWLMTTDPAVPDSCWLRSGHGVDFHNYALTQDPWYPGVKLHAPGEGYLSSRFATDDEVRRSPLHVRYCAVIVIERTEWNEHFVAFNRLTEAGNFDEDHEWLLRECAPHLRRAYALHTRLHSPFAYPSRTNPGLADSPTSGVELRHNRIRVADHRAEVQLEGDLERVRIDCDVMTEYSANVVRLARRANARCPLVFTVVPLNPHTSAFRFDCMAAACVLIDDLEMNSTPSALSLTEAFGLTPSESPVAMALTRISDLVEVATARNVSVETIRTQLKSIRRKTNVTKQSELAVLINRMAVLQRT